jgi:Zn-dependent peptidase ImmA (M78 family)
MLSKITRLRDLVPLHRLSTDEVLELAEAQAERLLRLTGSIDPPVSEDIISTLDNIRIERQAGLGTVRGAVRRIDKQWLIIVNERDSRGRQRWSIAHELKHILDHPFETILYPKRDERDDLAEQACDYFAGCLLMPSSWLRQAWSSGMRETNALARRFGVTTQAVTVRLLQIGLIQPTDDWLMKGA